MPAQMIRRYDLPNFPGREPRGLLCLDILVRDEMITFCNTHLDHLADDSLRYRQAVFTDSILSMINNPVILMGDLNDVPDSRTVSLLGRRFHPVDTVATYPAEDPDRMIDYILVDKQLVMEFRQLSVPAVTFSDHRPLILELLTGKFQD
jgi:endonuclease/exonuclease/phosphatase family metal-dependent hydrolase